MRAIIYCLFILRVTSSIAQTAGMSLDESIKLAKSNNLSIRSANYEVEAQQSLKKTGFDLPKTNAMLMYGQYNGFRNDNNITVTQVIPFTTFGSQANLNRALVASSQLKKAATENELVFRVKQIYYLLAYTMKRRELLQQQDSIYEGFLKSASYRYTAGEAKLLEKVTAETQRNDTKNQLMQNEADIDVLRTQLGTLLGTSQLPDISVNSFEEISVAAIPDSASTINNPLLAFQRQQVEVAKGEKKVAKAASAPDLTIGYFNQTLIDAINMENGAIATKSDRFSGVQVGLAIPLWFVSHQGRVQAAEAKGKAAQSTYQYQQTQFNSELNQAIQRYDKSKNSLAYYKDSALPNADLILKQAQTAFREGDVDFAEYLLSVKNALAIREGFLQTLSEYNQSIIYIEFLSGNK